MNPRHLSVSALALPALAALCAGCMSWNPSWREAGRPAPGEVSRHRLEEARALTGRATDRQGVQTAIAAYRAVLAADPADVDALTELANHNILLATAYTRGARAKRALYREAMKCCELAMYTHPGFRKLADEGRPPWEACEALTEREMGAMLFWVTALLYDFKECMSAPAKVGNIEWIRRAGLLLARMETIDPGWRGGVIPMSWSFYYYILPASMGGSVETARAKLEESVRIGPDRLLNRWARARFFRVVTGDRAGFVEDLQWVAAQSPDRMQDDPHWKAYILRDAGQLLQDVDRYF